jgi:Predicted nucleotide-binding protein containing TIR-like domain
MPYIPPLNQIPAPPEPEHLSPVQYLEKWLEKGQEFLTEPPLHRDRLQTWNSLVRNKLEEIWGKNSPLSQEFASLPEVLSLAEVRRLAGERMARLKEVLDRLSRVAALRKLGGNIFIGHGRSLQWLVLKEFIAGRLHLPWVEFNSSPTPGYTTAERIEEMLDSAAFALIIMTAEDEHADAKMHARPNVIHEIGISQGRLGRRRAIVLLEQGCEEFSNIAGIVQIRFPTGNISATFEEIRRVLEREGILATTP